MYTCNLKWLTLNYKFLQNLVVQAAGLNAAPCVLEGGKQISK